MTLRAVAVAGSMMMKRRSLNPKNKISMRSERPKKQKKQKRRGRRIISTSRKRGSGTPDALEFSMHFAK